MKKIYWFYRRERLISPKDLWKITQNWAYTMSFYANNQYADYIEAWIVSIKDNEIPLNRYTKEVVPWVKDLREFAYMEYDETILDDITINNIITKIGSRFDLELLTTEEAITFIKWHTDLIEEAPWKFLITEAYIDEDWTEIPNEYLIID